jgi:predicted O-linked N-acetylglucosamine transferase (SPINDLY family)
MTEFFPLHLAKLAFEQQRYEDAIALYQDYLANSPNDVQAYWYLGLSQFLLGQEEEAQTVWMIPLWEGLLEQKKGWESELISIFNQVIESQLDQGNISICQALRSLILEIYPNYDNPFLENALQDAINTLLTNGLSFVFEKRFQEAGETFIEILSLDEKNVSAWYNLAMVYYEMQLYENAYQTIQKLIELDHGKASHFYGLGLILEGLNKLDRAIFVYQKALEIDPSNLNAYIRLGMIFNQNQRYSEAEAIYREAIKQIPEHYGTYLNLANLLLDQERQREQVDFTKIEEIIALYKKVIELDKGELDKKIFYVFKGLASANEFIGATDEVLLYNASAAVVNDESELAIQYYNNYLKIKPDAINIYSNLFGIYKKLGKDEEAIKTLRQGINNCQNNSFLFKQLVYFYQNLGDLESAQAVINEAEGEHPCNPSIQRIKQWLLPIIYESSEEIEYYRERFSAYLDKLVDPANMNDDNHEEVVERINSLNEQTNFFLQYQGKNDLALQQKYGAYVHKLLGLYSPKLIQPRVFASGLPSRKIRIGYVSACMCHHTVGKLFEGWLKYADRRRFEIYSYYIKDYIDEKTYQYNLFSDVFHHLPHCQLPKIANAILEDNLDILVFLDVGMFPMMTLLAGLRLAPIQCTTWGHPITTGSPTMDYFLSCDWMEPAEGEEHYTEKLIRLPNISIAYKVPHLLDDPCHRAHFSLSESSVVYLSCQSLFKYLPKYDYIFPRIAVAVPQSQFVFIGFESQKLTDVFKGRLKRAFAELELNYEVYCVFLPRLNHQEYLSVNLCSDIFLDTLSWSGGNTTLEALGCCLPVITCPGEFMRGRHAYAILKTLGIEETIAQNEEEYIDLAVKLGHDPQWRQHLKDNIKTNQDRLFEDKQAVLALEYFYQQAIQNLSNQ